MTSVICIPKESMEIYHFGIKERSGRYPWGSGKRPHQRLESPEERKKRLDENRERVMKSGTASEIKEYISEMSSREIQEAVQRIEWTKRLNSLSESESKSIFEKIDKTVTKAGKVNKWIATGVRTASYITTLYKLIDVSAKQYKNKKAKGG